MALRICSVVVALTLLVGSGCRNRANYHPAPCGPAVVATTPVPVAPCPPGPVPPPPVIVPR